MHVRIALVKEYITVITFMLQVNSSLLFTSNDTIALTILLYHVIKAIAGQFYNIINDERTKINKQTSKPQKLLTNLCD